MMVVEERTVRAGYKMTELGEIPVEWSITPLAKIAIVRTEKFDPLKNANQIYIALEHIESNTGRLLGTDDSTISTSIKSVFKKNDVLFGKLRPYLRKYWYAKFDGVCATEIIPIIAMNFTYSKFLFYLMQSDTIIDFTIQNSFGTKMPRTSWKDLSNVIVAFPPLPEQQKIAEILSTVDQQIENTEKIIEKTKELKKGLMQQLLTKGIGHTEFKMTELGEIPFGWEVKTLGEISSIKGRVGWKGYTKKDLVDKGPFTLGATHIDKNNKLDLSNPVYLSQEKYDESPEIMVDKGDIIFAQRGSLGKLAIVNQDIGLATINPSMVLIKEINVNANFLYYYLCGDIIQSKVTNETSKTSIPMLSQAQINAFKIPLPSNKEQQKIAEVLSIVDELIDSYEQKKEKYNELKKGLMQQLLPGKLRVKL